jgi:hypothetical protein
VRGAERLSIRVSPTLSLPPAFIVVRAFVEADADNRALEVVADSNDFYASSRVPLNGAQSPRLSEVRFGGLPEGSYRITVSLVGTQGPRALATRAVQVGLQISAAPRGAASIPPLFLRHLASC